MGENQTNALDFQKMLNGFKQLTKLELMKEQEDIMIFGDWHLTDRKSKIHVDYKANCIKRLQECLQMVKDRKPKIVVFVGDLVGILAHDKNVETLEFQALLMILIGQIKAEVNGELYFVFGNHDEGGNMTDAQFFVLTGLFKRAEYIDVGALRLHLVDYGDEKRSLEIRAGASNIVVAHNEFFIGRETRWFFNSAKGFELADMTQWEGIDGVVSGHIHLPSPKLLNTSIGSKNVWLFYTGCQTQPNSADRYKKVFPVVLEVTNTTVEMDVIEWELGDGVFKENSKEEELEHIMTTLDSISVGKELPTHSREQLTEALKELTDYGLTGSHDYVSHLKIIGVMDKEALEFALQTIDEVSASNKGLTSSKW